MASPQSPIHLRVVDDQSTMPIQNRPRQPRQAYIPRLCEKCGLNLHALLGAQRADVGSIHTIWAVQDKIALEVDEEKALELKRETTCGQERVVWNANLSLPA